MTQKRKAGPKAKLTNWVRTGGAIGDDSFAENEKFNQEGAGVDEDDETEVGAMPNESVMRPLKKGSLR